VILHPRESGDAALPDGLVRTVGESEMLADRNR
jgi:hypothetical protein